MEAKKGDIVKIHYTGKLDDGTVFDTTQGRDALEFQLGKRQVIEGVERAVTGMTVGEKKQAEVQAEDAYGHYRDDMVGDVPKEQLPAEMDFEVGQQLRVTHGEGQTGVITVLEVSDTSVKIDMNHPLAGQTLFFELELVSVVNP